MAWGITTNIRGPAATPPSTYGGMWTDSGGNVAGAAVTNATGQVITDITTIARTPVGCSLSNGTVTVTQAGTWMFQGACQYSGSNTAMRAVFFVLGSSGTATPRYGLTGVPSGDALATDATIPLTAGQQVSFCTALWSGGSLTTWKNSGCIIAATWLGNPQDTATIIQRPLIITLTDAATIATNAALGNTFRVSLTANRTLGAPTNPVDGQRCIWEVTASGGARTLTLATGSAGSFLYGTDITGLTATVSGKTDEIGAIYNASQDRWRVVSYAKGF